MSDCEKPYRQVSSGELRRANQHRGDFFEIEHENKTDTYHLNSVPDES
jgi:hypothetical protein